MCHGYPDIGSPQPFKFSGFQKALTDQYTISIGPWVFWGWTHCSDVIIAMMSQITSVWSTVCSGADQRKHQSSAALAFVRGIHRWPVNSPPQKCFHLMASSSSWGDHDTKSLLSSYKLYPAHQISWIWHLQGSNGRTHKATGIYIYIGWGTGEQMDLTESHFRPGRMGFHYDLTLWCLQIICAVKSIKCSFREYTVWINCTDIQQQQAEVIMVDCIYCDDCNTVTSQNITW